MHRVRSVISATPVEHGNESADPASWQLCSVQAPIALALIVPEGMTALSNMPGSEPAAVASSLGLQQITFAATPNMSTYLLAICVGHIAGLSTLSGESSLTAMTSMLALIKPGHNSPALLQGPPKC